MGDLVATISSTKRKLKEASDKLDELFQINNEVLQLKREQLERQYRNFDKDKTILKITQRMIYLNRLPRTAITDGRIDELSRLLDWLEEN